MSKIMKEINISIKELKDMIDMMEKLDPFNNRVLGFKFIINGIQNKINKLYSSVERQLRLIKIKNKEVKKNVRK